MKKDSIFSKKFIGYVHDPGVTLGFQKPACFDNDLFLFSAYSESHNHIPFDRISVIGGRCSSSSSIYGKPLCDIISIPDGEKDLFIHSLYGSVEPVALIPLKNKILVIYNQLLRSNGIGLAFVFDYSPKCISALIHSNTPNSESVLISPTFSSLPEKTAGAMDFSVSVAHIFSGLRVSDTLSRFEPKCSVSTIFSVLNSASDLMGCPISVDIGELSSEEIYLDRPTLMAFSLCILSQVRRLSRDRRAVVHISAKEFFEVSIGFDLYSESDLSERISESAFCERMATEMGIPFCVEMDGGICRSSFIPYRADPSVLGFKAGIFINGKRFTRLP